MPLAAARVGVRRAPFLPTQLTGLAVWLDAGQITGAVDNAAVATWQDRSGNARDAVQVTATKQPLYHNTGGLLTLSGRPYVQFDNVDDSMAGAISIANRAVTIISVMANFVNIYLRDSAAPIPGELETNFYYTRSADSVLSNVALTFTTAYDVYVGVGAALGSATRAYTNGALTGTSAVLSGTEPATTRYSINDDSQGAGNSGRVTRLAEFLVYNRVLTDPERQQVEAYLKAKHGTP